MPKGYLERYARLAMTLCARALCLVMLSHVRCALDVNHNCASKYPDYDLVTRAGEQRRVTKPFCPSDTCWLPTWPLWLESIILCVCVCVSTNLDLSIIWM